MSKHQRELDGLRSALRRTEGERDRLVSLLTALRPTLDLALRAVDDELERWR